MAFLGCVASNTDILEVNTRNVCNIANAVALCSITELKDASLEYMCLQLESMLENQ